VSAHPRSRGEHVEAATVSREVRGSSPLARGARPAVGHTLSTQGLIPARAGSTFGDLPRRA